MQHLLNNRLFLSRSVIGALTTTKISHFAASTTTIEESSSNAIDYLSIPTEDQSQKEEQEKQQQQPNKFVLEFLQNRIETTPLQKLILSAGSSITALLDPHRHDMIACLGETTGEESLQNILQIMLNSDEGQRVLTQKPRINTKTINIDVLRLLPDNTFGRNYIKFLEDNNVTPDSRMPVRFMEDAELAYIMTRYRECHDLVHTILGMPTNMLGEVTVKWVEALNTGLPMCYGGAVFGAMRLRPKQRKEYKTRYLPWALKIGQTMKPLLPIYWEERWEQDINELRKELNIQILN